ncbi:putative fimbrial adhesin [Bordetella petrii]|uniref:Fimbrial adhesin n=2 Tax=Bordetella petrii TaxID=94624 RepID=A9IDF1_BORPD|nr:putative fimbrial adhesin [Bordetella petrii]
MPTSIVFASTLTCTMSTAGSGSFKPEDRYISNISSAALKTPPNPPLYTVLHTSTIYRVLINRRVMCTGEKDASLYSRLELSLLPPWKALPGGIVTIPGMSVGYRFVGATTVTESTMFLPSFPNAFNYTYGDNFHNNVMPSSQTVELIALGPISYDTISPSHRPIGYVRTSSNAIADGDAYYALNYARIIVAEEPPNIQLHTCKVPGYTVVDLGSHHFNGSTPGVTSPTVNFTIQLIDCPTGVPIRMGWKPSVPSAPTIPAPYTNSIMALDSTSTATGVGIQLLGEEGAEAIIADGTGYTMVTTQSQPTQPLKLSARYMQVAPNVTPGSAKTSGTFTITYP